jgi:Aldehyde dehydrogenase family
MADNPTMATYRWSSDRSEDRFTVENPATGDTIAVVQGGGAPEVDAAVQAAHRAFQDNWRWRSPAERAGLLLRGADVLEAHADELAELVSRENGKPVADARLHDIGFLIDIFRVLRVADRQAAQRVLRQGQRLHLDRARAAGRGRRDHPVQLAAHPRRRQDRAGARRRGHGRAQAERGGAAASRAISIQVMATPAAAADRSLKVICTASESGRSAGMTSRSCGRARPAACRACLALASMLAAYR